MFPVFLITIIGAVAFGLNLRSILLGTQNRIDAVVSGRRTRQIAARVEAAKKLLEGTGYVVTDNVPTVTATVMPDPTHSAEIVRLKERCRMMMTDHGTCLVFSLSGKPVFAWSNDGEYRLYNAARGQWATRTSNEQSVLSVLTKLAHYAPAINVMDPNDPNYGQP